MAPQFVPYPENIQIDSKIFTRARPRVNVAVTCLSSVRPLTVVIRPSYITCFAKNIQFNWAKALSGFRDYVYLSLTIIKPIPSSSTPFILQIRISYKNPRKK